MDHIVNRESGEMRSFSTASLNIAADMEDSCTRLKQLLYDANSYMQDDSGQEAISIVEGLAEDTLVVVGYMRTLAGLLKKSAELLEESNTLL